MPYDSESGERVHRQGHAPGERFAALIRTARKEAGVSQEELSEETGISRSQLIRWESGKVERPEPEAVRAVCSALEIDPREVAVALGYLTREEVSTPVEPLPAQLREVIQILEDPAISADEKKQWIDYLIYLRDKPRREQAAKAVKGILERDGDKPLKSLRRATTKAGAEAAERFLERDGAKPIKKLQKPNPTPPAGGSVNTTVPRKLLKRTPLTKETPPTE